MPNETKATAKRVFQRGNRRALPFTALGFGSAVIGNYQRPMTEEECDATLAAAWDEGLRYFDTAPFYGFGLSETRVRRLLRTKPRNEYILSTKVGRILEPCDPKDADGILFKDIPPFTFRYDYSYDGVMRSYEESLKRIGVDRADVLYVHDVDALVQGGRDEAEARIRELMDQGGWRALTELRDNGDIAAIGAGVNEWQPCARLLELADPDLFLLAGRYTLLEQEPLQTLFPECAKRGVGVVVGGPYNSGILAGGATFNYGAIPPEVADRAQRIKHVCEAHNVPMPQAALQFVLAHPVVVSVIPGPQSAAEMRQNAAYLNASTPAALWEDLKREGVLQADAPTPA